MTIFNKLVFGTVLIATTVATANATPTGFRNFDIRRYALKSGATEKNPSFLNKMAKVNKINTVMERSVDDEFSPTITFLSNSMIGDIDGPNNEIWFYTSSMEYKYIPHEYYMEQVLLEYSFDIYNASGELVGSIHDKMRYEENEVRTVECSLVPIISKNFFNDDDLYEVMIGIGVNCTKVYEDGTTEWLPNNYRNVVYSLGGEKETLEVEDSVTGDFVIKEFDKPVYRINGTLGDVLDASVGDQEEIYLTFYDETLPEYSDDDIISGDDGPIVSDEFWNKLTAAHVSLNVCGKVDAEGNLPTLMSFEIPILSMPGDQESTPFLISFRNGNDSYILIQYYKDIFFNQYNSPTDDLTMREHNSLLVDLYKVGNGEISKISSTEIPFVKDSKDRLLFSFHSVGDFRYAGDINFGSDGQPMSFFVTKNNYFADEHNEYNYYHYAIDGKKLNNIFEGAESHMAMTDLEGFEPQQMFVTYNNSEYFFHFVDLLSGKETTSFSCYLEIDPDSDPDMMTSNIDRTAVGDSYNYAVEMRTPTVDEDDNTIMRIGWLDAEGNFLKMDEVNMGQYVVFAQCYLDGYSLRKDFYLTDEPHEYMMLIKRGVDATTTQEDLLIGQAMNPAAPDGKDVLLLTANEKGNLSTINPYTMLEKPMLHIYYYDSNTDNMSMDIYYLPFDSSAVKEIESIGTSLTLAYDGMIVTACGHEIQVFDLQGRHLRTGIDSVRVDDLGTGVYIALANGEIRKFIVK